MSTTDILRNELIGKLLTISNKEYLSALNKIIDKEKTNNVKLSAEQKIMLEMSEDDIRNNRLVHYEDLSKKDLKWLKEL